MAAIKNSIATARSHRYGSFHFPFYTPATSKALEKEFEQIKLQILVSLRQEGYYVSSWMEIKYMKVQTGGRFQEIFIAWEESDMQAAIKEGYDFFTIS